MATDDAQSGTHDRAASRKRYETVLGIVRHNTGDPQPVLMKQSSVLVVATNGGLEGDAAKQSLKAAVDNGDLVRWRDGSGTWRVGLADPADGHFEPDDVDDLESVLAVETSRPDPDTEIVGWVNQQLAAIDTQGDKHSE